MSIETRPVARAKLIEACVAPKSILAARCRMLLQIFDRNRFARGEKELIPMVKPRLLVP
jgi:hypothetical protein